jgi:uncharacterized membrane protein YvbJ
MAEIITPKREPLFGTIQSKNGEKTLGMSNTPSTEKKSFFKSKKFIAIAAVIFIAIVVVAVIVLTGTEYQEEVISKSALLLPLFFRED